MTPDPVTAECFAGGVAVITGAGAGIGEGLVRYAAAELDMTVVLADVDASAIARLRAELERDGGRAVDVACDVRNPDDVARLAQRGFELGPVRLLVNNAGIEQFGYLWDVDDADWARLLDVNVSGVFHGVRAFLPAMMSTPDPSWVWNLSSIGAMLATALQAPYVMSKHAVLALTECLHQEVALAGAGHVHVQAVLPAAVTSRIFESAAGVSSGDVAAAEVQRAAMAKIGARAMAPREAAEAIFAQAAAGHFYLLTDPERVGHAMDSRAEVLRGRRAPVLAAPSSAGVKRGRPRR